MATPKKLFRGSAPATLTTAYTVPTGGTAIVTNIVASNPGTTAGSVTVRLGGFDLISTVGVAAKGVMTFEVSQVLAAGETVQVQGSGSVCSLHISGVEV